MRYEAVVASCSVSRPIDQAVQEDVQATDPGDIGSFDRHHLVVNDNRALAAIKEKIPMDEAQPAADSHQRSAASRSGAETANADSSTETSSAEAWFNAWN
jgi:hypothetical protein